jgi:hypothetical protein
MSTPAPNGNPVAAGATGPKPGDVPCSDVLIQAAKLAIKMDRPINLDYFMDTYLGKGCLGEDAETKDRILVKSGGSEWTSMVKNVYRIGVDYIILTENSIYITSGKMVKKNLNKEFWKKIAEEDLEEAEL